ncbi:MAG: hypothetical protein ABIN48_02830 [Ginsengibacter sp.]
MQLKLIPEKQDFLSVSIIRFEIKRSFETVTLLAEGNVYGWLLPESNLEKT